MTSDLRTIAADAAKSSRDDRGHRSVVIFAVISALGALALAAVFVISRTELRSDIDALTDQSAANAAIAENNEQAAQALAEQVRSLGAQPVIEPEALQGP